MSQSPEDFPFINCPDSPQEDAFQDVEWPSEASRVDAQSNETPRPVIGPEARELKRIGEILASPEFQARIGQEREKRGIDDIRREQAKKTNPDQYIQTLREQRDALAREISLTYSRGTHPAQELHAEFGAVKRELHAAHVQYVVDNTEDDTFHPSN